VNGQYQGQLSTQEIDPENTVTETSSTTEKSPKSTEKQEQDQSSQLTELCNISLKSSDIKDPRNTLAS